MKIYYIILNNNFYNLRIDKILSILFPIFSRNYIQYLIKKKNIFINNKFIKKSIKNKNFKIIKIIFKKNNKKKCFLGEKIFFKCIYEDQEILIINKPIKIVVHPAPGHWYGTLFNGLLYKYPKLINIPRLGIIHRLDKNTSGIMIIAKTIFSYYKLIKQFKDRIINKYYLALVWGHINKKGIINNCIIRDFKNRKKMTISKKNIFKKSITYYKRLAISKIKKVKVSFIYCKIKTGRTHQIRIHMKNLGFPLIGDNLYGKKKNIYKFKYQALIAKKISFIHPKKKKKIFFTIKLSSYFLNLLK
ncbi:RluA family pseudouridine synthase [Candidatus Zinderia endosymbiont of Aphrophora alni]|uniref:RluA family pseudouridine synthase n=1 Tax=Candidatus Zinderia endosymbiont of Aphrophora alni TaxID=3077951 RepID=UPI0030CEE270